MADQNLLAKVRAYFTPRSLIRLRRQEAAAYEPDTPRFPATITAVAGSTQPNNQTGFVYVRPWNESKIPMIVWNDRVNPRDGLHVWVGPQPGLPNQLAVLSQYTHQYPPETAADVNAFAVPPHGETHEIVTDLAPGLDPVRTFLAALMPFKTGPYSGLTVSTYAYEYQVDGLRRLFPGLLTDLSGQVPGPGLALRVLLYLDLATNTLTNLNGPLVADSPIIQVPFVAVPRGGLGSAWIKLVGGQTAIGWADVTDARPLFDTQGTAEPYVATRYGEILISQDAVSFSAALPVIDPETGAVMTDPETMTILVT